MHADHLVCLGSLVDVAYLTRDHSNALSVRENRLFELLQSTVSKAKMIINIRLVRRESLLFQTVFEDAEALAVLGSSEVGQAELVHDLRVIRDSTVGLLKVSYGQGVFVLVIEVAVCTVPQEINIIRILVLLDSVTKESDSRFIVSFTVKTLSDSIKHIG